jgi:hypothetical protein
MSTTKEVTVIFQESGHNCTGYTIDYGSDEEKITLVNKILSLFAKAGKNAKIKNQLIDLLGLKTEKVKTDEFVNNPSWQRTKWTSSMGTIWVGL